MSDPTENMSSGLDAEPKTELGKFWTAANVLSMLRFVIVIPVTYLIIVDGSLLWILSLLILALTTDYLDGSVARWSKSVSNWGKVLDPAADKMGGAMVITALTIVGKLPVWFLATVIVRDLLIILGGEIIRRRTGEIGMSILSGKLAVSAVAITALAALLQADPPVMRFCLTATTVLLVFSYLRYLQRFFRSYAVAKDELDYHPPGENENKTDQL